MRVKNNIIITNIHWLSEEALEARIKFQANGAEFVASCHPCHLKLGENEVLISIDEFDKDSEPFLDGNPNHLREIKGIPGTTFYSCFGKISAMNPLEIDFGNFMATSSRHFNDERLIGHFVYTEVSEIWIL